MKLKKIFKKQTNRNIGDIIYKNLTLTFAIIVFLLVILMSYQMYIGAELSIKKFGWKFLYTSTWDPVKNVFGGLPSIYGTFITSFIAIIICISLGLGVAIFLSELAPNWLEKPLSFLTELLAGIPSVIYGLWGIFVLVPWLRRVVEPFLIKNFGNLPFFQGAPYGFGILAAALVLSVMVLPIISSISRDVLNAVPNSQREAAYALGATRWEVIKITLAYSRTGILGAIMLGFGRAVGETMAVTMVIGNRPIISASLLDPAYTMASAIANEFAEASSDIYLSALIELALILFVITILINIAARLLIWRLGNRWDDKK